jgi:hypothetical protein
LSVSGRVFGPMLVKILVKDAISRLEISRREVAETFWRTLLMYIQLYFSVDLAFV